MSCNLKKIKEVNDCNLEQSIETQACLLFLSFLLSTRIAEDLNYFIKNCTCFTKVNT